MKVGFIGLGDQGTPMARAIARAGWDLHVWARREASLAAVAPVRHTVHETVASLASECDIVGLCLRDDNDIESMFIENGLLDAMTPGSVLVNHGTGSPDVCLQWNNQSAKRGVAVLDAPVSGGREAAEKLTLTTMVGGNAEAYERCKPVFQSFSRKTVRMGPPGSGQLAKLINNTLFGANLKNAELALALAAPLKLDLAALLDMLRSSSGASFAVEALATQMTSELAPHYEAMVSKDVHHFMDAAGLRGVDSVEFTDAALAGVAGIVDTVETIKSAGCVS